MNAPADAENPSRNRRLYIFAIVIEVLFVGLLWLLGWTFGPR